MKIWTRSCPLSNNSKSFHPHFYCGSGLQEYGRIAEYLQFRTEKEVVRYKYSVFVPEEMAAENRLHNFREAQKALLTGKLSISMKITIQARFSLF